MALEDVQKRQKMDGSRSMVHYNPAAPAARAPRPPTSARPLASSDSSCSAALQRSRDLQSMDAEEAIPSRSSRSVSASFPDGEAGSSRDGGGGGGRMSSRKGKEREHSPPDDSSPATGQLSSHKKTKVERKKVLSSKADIEDLSDGSDIDDIPPVGNAGRTSPPHRSASKSTSRSFSAPALPGSKRQMASSDEDETPSAPKKSSPRRRTRPPTPDPPLPKFRRKSDTSVHQRTLTNSPSPVKPVKPKIIAVDRSQAGRSVATTSSAGPSRRIHDLDDDDDSPEKPSTSKPRWTLPVDSRSPSSPRHSKGPSSVASSSSSSRRDRDEVEDDLTPKKRPKPKPKANLQPAQSSAAPAGVSNPFAARVARPPSPVDPTPAEPTIVSRPQILKSTPSPFPWLAAGLGTEATTSTSKPIAPVSSKKSKSRTLPESDSDEDDPSAVGVLFQSKKKAKVHLTPNELEDRKRATRESIIEKPTILDSLSGFALLTAQTQQAAKAKKLKDKRQKEKEEERKVQQEKDEQLYGKEEVAETDRRHWNPWRLCIFCSEELPSKPSAKLTSLIARLKPLGRPAPTMYNPQAVSLPMIQSINVCTLHRSESSQLPIAQKKGWPTEIDWTDVQRRVRKPAMIRELNKVILAKESSVFFGFAKEQAERVGAVLARTAKGQYEVATKSQPGYYGEIGQILFHQVLSSIYTPSKSDQAPPDQPILTATLTSPLTPSDFVFFVLVPEVAVRLIQQDLKLARSVDAFDVLMDSRAYGHSRFAAEEGEGAGGALMQGWDDNAVALAHGEDDGVAISRRRKETSVSGRITRDDRDATPKESKRPPKMLPSSSPVQGSSANSKTISFASSAKAAAPDSKQLASIFTKHTPKPKPTLKPPGAASTPSTSRSSLADRRVPALPIDLDSDDAKENKPKGKKVDRDKTATPPVAKKPKIRKKAEEAYFELDDSEPDESLGSRGRSSPVVGAEGQRAQVFRFQPMERTESDRMYFPSSDSFDVADIDPDAFLPSQPPSPTGKMPNIDASFYDDDKKF